MIARALFAGLLVACGTTYEMTPATVQVVKRPAAPPPPGTYVADVQPTPRVQACLDRNYAEAADAVKCMSLTGDEAALPALLAIGLEKEVVDDPPTPFHDSAGAAAAAGAIASATSSKELLAMTHDPSAAIEGFAAMALAKALDASRSGPSFAELAPRAGAACAGVLDAADPRAAMSAAACVIASRDPAATTALARAFAARKETGFRLQVGPTLAALAKGALDENGLRPFGDYLRAPLPDKVDSDERKARDLACATIAAQLEPPPKWAVDAARVAWVSVQQKTNGATGEQLERCAALGKMTD